jgi:large subunit ribosomal protein L21
LAYAVIRTGGKQYRVSPGVVLRVEKLEAEPGATIELGEVLLTGGDDGVRVGQPLVAGVSVTARVVEQGKAKKILVFKKRRRKRERRRYGHRQPHTTIQVLEIKSV